MYIVPLFEKVVNKWFALQAMSDVPGNVENVKKLLDHPAFDLRNPNKVYSLIGGFCGSPVNFHAKDGSGYKFLGEFVVQLDKTNPQVFVFLIAMKINISMLKKSSHLSLNLLVLFIYWEFKLTNGLGDVRTRKLL